MDFRIRKRKGKAEPKRYFFYGMLNGLFVGWLYGSDWGWQLIFFALTPLLLSLLSGKGQNHFLWGYGLGYYWMGMHWLYSLVPRIPASPVSAVILLTIGILIIGVCLTFLLWAAFLPLPGVLKGNGFDLIKIAAFYLLGEWLPGILPIFPFPWFRLGTVISPFPAALQGASVFGSLYLAFWIVLINGFFAWVLMGKKADRGFYLIVVLILSHLVYGEFVLEGEEEVNQWFPVLLVQGGHGGMEKWNMSDEELCSEYLQITEQEIREGTRLVVWPETAIPVNLPSERGMLRKLERLCREKNTEIITGAFDDKEGETYNAMYHITNGGLSGQVYYKQILVPFGEYLPFDAALQILSPGLSSFVKDNAFRKGEETTIFTTGAGRAGGIICYESVFPRIARNAVKEGAEFLMIVSNDSWFGTSAALKEHHAHGILRAVEENRYLVRASNTGVTSIIDNRGRVQIQAPLMEEAAVSGTVLALTKRTGYSYYGDIIVIPALLLWILGFYRALFGKQKVSP